MSHKTYIRKNYTGVVRWADKYRVILQVGVQQFTIAEVSSRREANWFRSMLVIALDRMVEESVRMER